MHFSNTGIGSYNFATESAGLVWPASLPGASTAVFVDGFLIGAQISDSEVRIEGSTYRSGLQPGKILSNGQPDNPDLEKYRIFKTRPDWQELPFNRIDRFKKDYEEWPWEDGAPWVDVNIDGKYTPYIDQPEYIGDEISWFVCNDMNPSNSTFLYGSSPIGLEIQVTIYGFNRNNSLGDAVFKKYKIINKSGLKLFNVYFSIFSDPDLGYNMDDFIGCDTLLGLGYCYNADSLDNGGYGENPPAVGYVLLQGPRVNSSNSDSALFNGNWIRGFKNKNITAFWYNNPDEVLLDGSNADIVYRWMQGRRANGNLWFNPITNDSTTFPFSGDPVTQSGWIETLPAGDRRIIMSTGPVYMAVDDTQEVAYAIFLARDKSNLLSLKALKNSAAILKLFYNNYKPTLVETVLPPAPENYFLSQNYPNPFNPVTRINFELPVSGHTTL
ncbi:MAG: hypothetical protein HXY49_06695 [Ignavibacteriaceae bacterium]|nr:hypothetical protein [Ignavibacteriaceae bacterium]